MDVRLRRFPDRAAHLGRDRAALRSLHADGWVYDTEPAARAVVTMRSLHQPSAFPFFERVQRAFYAEAVDVTQAAAYPPMVEQFGVEPAQFLERFDTKEMRQATRNDFATARS